MSSPLALFRKLIRTLNTPIENPAPPLVRKESYDVLLSVWNIFRNREQRRGFVRNGLSVHWVGNHYPPQKGEVTKRSFGWIPFAVFMSAFFLKTRQFGIHLSMWLFNLYSGSRRLNTKLVWAYVELNPWLLKRAKKRGIPIVLDNPIAHMDDYYALKPEFEACGFRWPDWWIRRWVAAAKREYALADWFNVGSSFVKETLVAHGIPADRVIVNHTGVDTEHWVVARKNRQVGPGDPFVFVFTGSVDPRKGIRYLMQAWKEVALDNAELWICGGTDRSMDWNRVCGGLPGNVRFFGRVKQDRLVELYSKASVYVLPSLLEGLARTGLEAMASGLPVIVTRETGLTDFVSDGVEGWIVPSRDAHALAERFNWCATHPDAVRSAGDAAFRHMGGKDFAAYGDQCATIAKQIIEGYAPPLQLSSPRENLFY